MFNLKNKFPKKIYSEKAFEDIKPNKKMINKQVKPINILV